MEPQRSTAGRAYPGADSQRRALRPRAGRRGGVATAGLAGLGRPGLRLLRLREHHCAAAPSRRGGGSTGGGGTGGGSNGGGSGAGSRRAAPGSGRARRSRSSDQPRAGETTIHAARTWGFGWGWGGAYDTACARESLPTNPGAGIPAAARR